MLHVSTTCPDPETAQLLAEEALQARLVACANIHAPVTSLYWWAGSIESAQEVAVVFKTTAANRPALVDLLEEMHPYDLPVITWEPVETTEDARAWLKGQTR